MDSTITRMCSNCAKPLPVSEFRPSRGTTLTAQCITCRGAKTKSIARKRSAVKSLLPKAKRGQLDTDKENIHPSVNLSTTRSPAHRRSPLTPKQTYRGIVESDSPAHAAARKKQNAIRRECRLQRRNGEDVPPTPALSQLAERYRLSPSSQGSYDSSRNSSPTPAPWIAGRRRQVTRPRRARQEPITSPPLVPTYQTQCSLRASPESPEDEARCQTFLEALDEKRESTASKRRAPETFDLSTIPQPKRSRAEEKKCSKCEVTKPLPEFAKNKDRTRYLQSCLQCQPKSYPAPVFLRAGKDSQDSPGTALKRKEITAIRRRHRAQCRDAQRDSRPADISQTPPLFSPPSHLPMLLPHPHVSSAPHSQPSSSESSSNFFNSSPLSLHPGSQSDIQSSFYSSFSDFGQFLQAESQTSLRQEPENPQPPLLSEEQWQYIKNFHADMDRIQMETCIRCKEKWFDMKLNRERVCMKCIMVQKRKPMPYVYGEGNAMDPGEMPHGLQPLTQVEEMLVARAHVQMVIKRVRGHQFHYSGHTVTFLQDVVKFSSALPMLPEDLDIVYLKPPAARADLSRFRLQFARDMKVRRGVVLAWLRHLKQHHPDYRHITILEENLSQLPEDGDISHRLPSALDDNIADRVDETTGLVSEVPEPETEEDLPPGAESMVPHSNIVRTELEQIQSQIDERRPRQRNDMPSIPEVRSTPLDEFSDTQRLWAMAFPTLFPWGAADFKSRRTHTVQLKQWGQHLLKWHDGRFARHPRFRYMLFDMLNRQRSSAQARYVVNNVKDLNRLSFDEFEERLNSDSGVLNKVARAGSNLLGTRPYWARVRSDLMAQARFMKHSAVFLTFSCADMQWHDLHCHFPGWQEFEGATDAARSKFIWKSVQENPHIVAKYLDLKLKAFCKNVLKPWLGYDDYWFRYEWQFRGTGHIHCLVWIEKAPEMDMSTEESRAKFSRYWDEYITAQNPDPYRRPDSRNPAALPFVAIANTEDQFAALLNRLQMHPPCTFPYCLRKIKGTDSMRCRFSFPRQCRDHADCSKEVNDKKYKFLPRRNQELLNQAAPVMTLGWQANIDIQPATSQTGVINYIGKYVSKPEKKSESYKEIQGQVLKNVNHRSPALSFASKFLNKLLAERDWSAQEINHILFEIPLTISSRDVVMLDCRKEQDRPAYGEMDEEGIRITQSKYTRYMNRKKDTVDFDANKRPAVRDNANAIQSDESSGDEESSSEEERYHMDDETPVCNQLDSVSLLEWLRYYNFKTGIRRPRAKPRCINYYPRYSNNPQSTEYEDYCRIKFLLHHPFYHMPELDTLQIDGQPVGSWEEAYRRCCDNHQHEADFLDPPDESDETDADDDLEEADLNQGDDEGVAEVGAAELLAGRNPRIDRTGGDTDRDLGLRPSDLGYDWTGHVGLYDVSDNWLAEMKSQFPTDQVVRNVVLNPNSLNLEQRKLFDTTVEHYLQELAGLNPCQLLLNVDGVAGSGKTYTVMQISVMLQEIARDHNRENPLQRAAPTGVAAYAINGSTLHSLLHLPVKTTFKELPSASLISLQRLFKDTRYLIIDEKSMVDLATLHFVDLRFRQIFPATDRPFGGLNVIICGDFFQLPPVGSEALYRKVPSTYRKVEAVAGRILYDQFNRTIRLQQQMRQLGQDESATAFRAALAELREGGTISIDSWDTLSSRVASELSPEEVASFNTAMRLYFKKERVMQFNYQRLAELDLPVLRISAKNEGAGAAAASSDEAENLSNTLCVCKGARVMLTKNLWGENGLVNGSTGTVRDIFWKESANPITDQPHGIMVEFDGYDGPTWSPEPDAIGQARSRWVPILAATARFNFKGVDCTRTMFPLQLCYAITVHKSQGMSLSRAVLNLSDSEFALGLTYVAVSRVKTLGGLMFESSFDLSRFKEPKGMTPRDRAEDVRIRNGQLI